MTAVHIAPLRSAVRAGQAVACVLPTLCVVRMLRLLVATVDDGMLRLEVAFVCRAMMVSRHRFVIGEVAAMAGVIF
ncbi:hypothetical protein ACH4LQ_14035 [Streptomyces globisporus]